MTFLRVVKSLSGAALMAGLFAVVSVDGLEAASKAAEAKKAIADLSSAKDAKAKAAALDEIGKIAQVQKSLAEPAMADIKKSLADKDASVRRAAAQCYGRCDPDPKEALPILQKMLKEDSEEVKFGVASGLAAMGPNAHDALPAVRDAMKVEKEKQEKDKGKQTKLGRELGDTAKAISGMKKKN
ncbi:hypothetical protein BH11PLA2_BH11PLA2_04120 [soil metagenome]